MSLREDMDFLERAIAQGKGREWLDGTYAGEPEPEPIDHSANVSPANAQQWLAARGE